MFKRLMSHLDTAVDKVLSSDVKEEADKPRKYEYSRPEFLNLNAEKIKVSQDFMTRPIVTPQDIMLLPYNAGYAECINGGKSNYNEDQATAKQFFWNAHTNQLTESSDYKSTSIQMNEVASGHVANSICVTYFGMFDGHAGADAALMTSKLLHKHIVEKLQLKMEVVNAKIHSMEVSSQKESQSNQVTDSKENQHVTQKDNKTDHYKENHKDHNAEHHKGHHTDHSNNHKDLEKYGPLENVSLDSLIVGSIEEAFTAMDEQIKREKTTYSIRGGCAVIVAIFMLGKLFVANAGDCRAVLYTKGRAVRLSRDMTPYSERQRILALGTAKPELLHEEFTCNEYLKRITRSDMGKLILYRGPSMAGWGYKIAEQDDLKVPLITCTGNKSRLMQTIGVARGFGDHDLRLYDSQIYMKPFLSSSPEVCVYDLKSADLDDNDVLVIGSDGLWDLLKVEEVRKSVSDVLNLYNINNHKRYISAAQELVSQARGGISGNSWKKKNGDPASFDDISVFVIPLKL